MALKHKVTSLDEVAEKYRALYTQLGNEYVLDDEVKEDTTSLKNAKDHEKAERQKAEQRASVAESRLKQIDDKDAETASKKARADKDIESIDATWQARFDSNAEELNAKICDKDAAIHKLVIKSTAMGIATKIAIPGTAKFLAQDLEARLEVGERNGEIVALVKDANGVASGATTLDALQQSFVDNPEYASLIVGSKASGGGAGESNGGGASTKSLSEMNDAERTQLHNSNPAAFSRLVDEQNKAF